MQKIIILIGKPGAGKGTLMKKFLPNNEDYQVISPGEIFRQECKNRSKLGRKIAKAMKTGTLLPDDVVNEVVFNAISESEKNVVLDGYPRTISQAKALIKHQLIPDKVIEIYVKDDEVKRRVAGRIICKKCQASYNLDFMKPKIEGVCDYCGGKLVSRADDKLEAVEKRLNEYHKETAPTIKFLAEASIEVEEFDGTSFDYEAFVKLMLA